MKKLIQHLTTKRNHFNNKLKYRLDGLPPDVKLNIILLMMALYLAATILVLIGIVRERNNETAKFRHIETAPLIDKPLQSSQQAVDTTYSYPPVKKNNWKEQ